MWEDFLKTLVSWYLASEFYLLTTNYIPWSYEPWKYLKKSQAIGNNNNNKLLAFTLKKIQNYPPPSHILNTLIKSVKAAWCTNGTYFKDFEMKSLVRG